MDNNELATKRDWQALQQETRADLQTLRDELIEVIRDTETKLLKAFYSFAESNQKRLLFVETSAAQLVERLATIEGRVTDIEKRLNLPPTS